MEARSLRPGTQHGGVLVKALSWVADCQLPVVSLLVGKSETALWGLF